MIRLYLFAAFLFSTSCLNAQQIVEDSDSLFTLKRDKYVFQYPKTWAVDTSRIMGIDAFVRSPKSDSLDDFYENVNVFVQDLKAYHYTLDKMGKESEAQVKNMVTDVELIESRFDSLSSPPKYIIHYKGRQGKYMLTTIQHYYLYNDTGFAITLTIQSGKEQEYIQPGYRILNSFKLVP